MVPLLHWAPGLGGSQAPERQGGGGETGAGPQGHCGLEVGFVHSRGSSGLRMCGSPGPTSLQASE